jgi:hypothetical protein
VDAGGGRRRRGAFGVAVVREERINNKKPQTKKMSHTCRYWIDPQRARRQKTVGGGVRPRAGIAE